jgi:Antitoxin Phd_YefM, type II toxin-antitoxin system
MKTCSLSEAKSSLGKLADDALRGHPTIISRGGKLVVLRAYEPSDPEEFDALIDEGIKSEHIPLADSVWEGIRQRGSKLAQKLRND